MAAHIDGLAAEWKDMESRRQPFYGPYSRKAREAREEIVDAAIEQVEASRLPQFAIRAAASATRNKKAPVRDLLRDLYRNVGKRFARSGARQVREEASGTVPETKQDAEDTWFDEVERWLSQEGGQEIRQITETVRRDVVGLLTEAREEGLGAEEMAKSLERNIDDVNRLRGRVIARTEVVSASNHASQEGAKSTGLTLEKEWFDSDDGRVRRSHRVVDGQRIPMDDPYQWASPESGQVSARFPGDPELPAAERIQCRCVELHHPV